MQRNSRALIVSNLEGAIVNFVTVPRSLATYPENIPLKEAYIVTSLELPQAFTCGLMSDFMLVSGQIYSRRLSMLYYKRKSWNDHRREI